MGLISLLAFTACNNTNSEAEAARLEAERAKAEADSLKQVLQNQNNGGVSTTDIPDLGMPVIQSKETNKLNPVDEAPLNTDFAKFRAELLKQVAAKNADFVLKHLDENVKVSFGSDGGLEDFKSYWFTDAKRENEFWQTFGNMLRLGGTFDDDSRNSFTFPYPFATWNDNYDPFTHGVITGSGVRLRDAPNKSGAKVASLSYDIVEFKSRSEKTETINGQTHSWLEVGTYNNQTGFVFGQFVYSAIGYRGNFQKVGDTWKLKFFIAGD